MMAAAALVLGVSPGTMAATQATIPVVKCPLETMTGAESVSAPSSVRAAIPASWAAQISYYTIGSLGAFGPRGWHCAGNSGSSGATILIAPGAAPSFDEDLIGRICMRVALYSGSTSGRTSVLGIGAPLFANLRALAPKARPFPGERVNRVGADIVTVVDPPSVRGSSAGSGGAYTSYAVVIQEPQGAAAGGASALPDLRVISLTAPAKSAALMRQLVALNARR
jgi:hypothetical protein